MNKYIFMYRKVASTVMKLLFIYCFFVISFALGFYVMFHDDMGDERLHKGTNISPYQFFNTPYESFAKTMTMGKMCKKLSSEKLFENILSLHFFVSSIFIAIKVVVGVTLRHYKPFVDLYIFVWKTPNSWKLKTIILYNILILHVVIQK